ncbi:Uncharacterised protein [Mycobacteroides abscessus subsp. abscessus]|nr:Uncharacterised protein [Mycobacteroides abscessus subsp. abscessus]
MIGGETVRELGGRTLRLAVSRRGTPPIGLGIKIPVEFTALHKTGVLTHRAFVRKGHCHPGQLPHPKGKPTAVVHRIRKSGETRRHFRGAHQPAGHVVVCIVPNSCHGVTVLLD